MTAAHRYPTPHSVSAQTIADERERAHLSEAQQRELVEEADALREGGLRLTGEAIREIERDLADAHRGAHDDLEQDLEAARLKRGEVDRRRIDREEARHRIRHAAQLRGEHRARDGGRRARDEVPPPIGEPRGAAVAHIARGGDEIDVAPAHALDELGDLLRRVLQVAVHHHARRVRGGAEPGHHRSPEPVHGLVAVDDAHRQVGRPRDTAHLVVGAIGRIVDEEDLGVGSAHGGGRPPHELGDVSRLVERRDHDGHAHTDPPLSVDAHVVPSFHTARRSPDRRRLILEA